ncbi:MAG: four helix bundle protein [Campylobacterales bacterium]|nr:four helix bundle protein [Campylobacterales bacterium]
MKCKNLEVWKKSATLSSEIYLELANLKDFGFKDQLSRSGLSIPSNIAEGLERVSDKETIRFLDIARGSTAEAQTQIYIGIKIKYINPKVGYKWIEELEGIGKMITGLINSINKRENSHGN